MTTTTSGMTAHARAADDGGLEHCEFAPPAEPPERLVVATYNIRYAVGSRLISGGVLRKLGISRPGRRGRLVAGNIRAAAAAFSSGRGMPSVDLLALQEADRGTLRSGGRHIARDLATALSLDYVRAASPTPHDVEPKDRQWYLDFEEPISKGEAGDIGVAILSRYRLIGASRVELPWSECPWRPRIALAATVPLAVGSLRVVCAHIDPHAGLAEQIGQHEAVLAHAERTSAGGPVLLLGDFNTLVPRARLVIRQFLESRGYTTPMPTGTGTWRTGPLRLHADWVFTRGLRVLRWGVERGLRVSDHWPVWAEVERE